MKRSIVVISCPEDTACFEWGADRRQLLANRGFIASLIQKVRANLHGDYREQRVLSQFLFFFLIIGVGSYCLAFKLAN